MIIVEEEYEEAIEKEEFYSTFVELEILFKKLVNMIDFCFDYMPSSIEIIEPERVELQSKSFSDLLNDIQTRLHNTDVAVKNANMQCNVLQANFDAILKNLIIMSLRTGDKTFAELAADTGMKEHHLQEVVKVLLPDEVIEYDGHKISLNKSYRKYNQNIGKD